MFSQKLNIFYGKMNTVRSSSQAELRVTTICIERGSLRRESDCEETMREGERMAFDLVSRAKES